MEKYGRSVNHKKILDKIWPCGDKIMRFGHTTIKQDCNLIGALKLLTIDFKGNIDVGDKCWRPNVLVTSLRCWLSI